MTELVQATSSEQRSSLDLEAVQVAIERSDVVVQLEATADLGRSLLGSLPIEKREQRESSFALPEMVRQEDSSRGGKSTEFFCQIIGGKEGDVVERRLVEVERNRQRPFPFRRRSEEQGGDGASEGPVPFGCGDRRGPTHEVRACIRARDLAGIGRRVDDRHDPDRECQRHRPEPRLTLDK